MPDTVTKAQEFSAIIDGKKTYILVAATVGLLFGTMWFGPLKADKAFAELLLQGVESLVVVAGGKSLGREAINAVREWRKGAAE